MTTPQNEDGEKSETLEVATDQTASRTNARWGWGFLIVLTLCITGYQIAELFITGG